MVSETVIISAFKHLAGIVRSDEVMEQIHSRSGLASWFSGLPWDEKMFKVGDGASREFSPDSGSWLARVSKDGPTLILTPTMDLGRATIIVHARNFWHYLTGALEAGDTDLASSRSRGRHESGALEHPPAASASAPVPELALNRWDKRAFQRWTAKTPRQPAPKPQRRGTGSPSAAYSIFYQ